MMIPSEDMSNSPGRFRIPTEEQDSNTEYVGLDLKDIVDRLRTFSHWSLPFLSKEVLAAAGFYYTGRSDIVKCAFCKVEIGKWVSGDDPETEHRKFSSTSKCLFLLWSKSTTPENHSLDGATEDTCGPYGLNGVKDTILGHDRLMRAAAMGDTYHNATYVSVHEKFLYYCERLKTFDDWSSDSKVSKEALSEAGFIYRHEEDHTMCFHCGGALRKWEDDDKPWEEHAGWFPDCKYLLTMKGQKFIIAARKKKSDMNIAKEESSAKTEPSRSNT